MRTRKIALGAVALVSLFTAGLATVPAQAAGTADASIDAVEPTLVGGGDVDIFWRAKNAATGCKVGRICLSVKDPTKGASKYWKVYSLTTCDIIYKIYNWKGGGFWENNQTGGAYGTFYSGGDGDGYWNDTEPAWAPAKPPTRGPYGWTPINSVRACTER
ncbi:hypothetical protein [Streptomyces sp. NPDC020607]|uniref:hypothetical protein n=1 Tax=Streptomyces sp. NPDC020607 TaxID=3365082 RepID=UPI003797CFDD